MSIDSGAALAQMAASQQEALSVQSEINAKSAKFNSAMAALSAEQKAWEKIKG